MPDEQPFRDPREDPRIVALEKRLTTAMEGFGEINHGRREGEPVFNLDNSTIMLARLDALASVLVSAGVIDYVEFTGEHLQRECEVVEKALHAAREIKRQQSGLILPPHRNGDGS